MLSNSILLYRFVTRFDHAEMDVSVFLLVVKSAGDRQRSNLIAALVLIVVPAAAAIMRWPKELQ